MSELTAEHLASLANTDDLAARFPGVVTPDERKGYQGYLVNPESLIEVVTSVRDDLGYDYLSSVTGVDYLPDGKMEVVYHLFRSTGGPGLVLKAQTPREDPVVPSLVPVFPGAELQEREAWDLLGIRFDGHPDLRRNLILRKNPSLSRAAGQKATSQESRTRIHSRRTSITPPVSILTIGNPITIHWSMRASSVRSNRVEGF
jgi:NADH:ubiquinone oxidoreductase subunit C